MGRGDPLSPKNFYCLGKFVSIKSFTNSIWQFSFKSCGLNLQKAKHEFFFASTNFGKKWDFWCQEF